MFRWVVGKYRLYKRMGSCDVQVGGWQVQVVEEGWYVQVGGWQLQVV
jgi:hypothetical protein